jgi:putative endonuclease
MPTPRTQLGTRGEELARRFLQQNGYEILECNYRCRWDEIDIVAQDGDEVVFLEVRSRRSADYGTPEESLTAAKLRRLLATAQHYLQQRGQGEINWRIDLVSVRLGRDYRLQRIEHLKHAVQL